MADRKQIQDTCGILSPEINLGQIKQWFTFNRYISRCTLYRKLVSLFFNTLTTREWFKNEGTHWNYLMSIGLSRLVKIYIMHTYVWTTDDLCVATIHTNILVFLFIRTHSSFCPCIRRNLLAYLTRVMPHQGLGSAQRTFSVLLVIITRIFLTNVWIIKECIIF